MGFMTFWCVLGRGAARVHARDGAIQRKPVSHESARVSCSLHRRSASVARIGSLKLWACARESIQGALRDAKCCRLSTSSVRPTSPFEITYCWTFCLCIPKPLENHTRGCLKRRGHIKRFYFALSIAGGHCAVVVPLAPCRRPVIRCRPATAVRGKPRQGE